MPPKKPAKKQITPCQIRLQRDLDDLPECGDVEITFPEPGNIQHFILRINVQQGLYKNHKFDFEFIIPDEWPIERPKVKILTKTWHPNLSEPPEGGVCISILRKNYSPITTINAFVASFQYLFNQPNPRDPLNVEAATQFIQNYPAFKLKAEEYMEKYCPK